jgi:hypothetical protein
MNGRAGTDPVLLPLFQWRAVVPNSSRIDGPIGFAPT